MSQENVDAFLEHVEAVNRADVPGALRFMDPEIQFETQVSALQGSYTGHDGARAFFTDIFGHFDVFQVHFSDVRDLGDQVRLWEPSIQPERGAESNKRHPWQS